MEWFEAFLNANLVAVIFAAIQICYGVGMASHYVIMEFSVLNPRSDSGFEDRMWDLIVSVPDHCLSFYFTELAKEFRMVNRICAVFHILDLFKSENNFTGSFISSWSTFK